MQRIKALAQSFVREEDGATMIEYALLAVLIAAKPTPSVMPTKNFPSRVNRRRRGGRRRFRQAANQIQNGWRGGAACMAGRLRAERGCE